MPASHNGVSVSPGCTHLHFPVNMPPERQQLWLKQVAPCHQCGRPGRGLCACSHSLSIKVGCVFLEATKTGHKCILNSVSIRLNINATKITISTFFNKFILITLSLMLFSFSPKFSWCVYHYQELSCIFSVYLYHNISSKGTKFCLFNSWLHSHRGHKRH